MRYSGVLPSRDSSRQYGINRGLIAETGQIPTGMQLIQDTFSFEVIDKKNTVTEDAYGRESPIMKVTGLFQKGDSQNANGRVYPTSDVLAPAVKSIQEDVQHRSVLGEFDHPCLCSPDFRVLTTEGWKNFSEVAVGDYVWSRIDGHMVKSRVNHIINDLYDGIAYRVAGKNINAEFSPGHRFLFENRPDQRRYEDLYATIDDIYHNRKHYSHCRVPRTATYETTTSDVVVIPGIPREQLVKDAQYYSGEVLEDYVVDARIFASFLGLYLAEGSVKTNTVSICQKNQHGRELVATLLQEFGLPYKENERGFRIVDKRLAELLRPLGNLYTKYIPSWVKKLSADCLEQLVYWFAIGDGRMLVAGDRISRWLSHKTTMVENGGVITASTLDLGKYSRMSIFTVSKQLIDDLHECVIKAGFCGRLSETVTENDYVFADRTIKASNKATLYHLSISRNKGFNLDPRFTSVEPFHHRGNIYCLSVDRGNFYMEYKGMSYWTGNSDAKIHLDRVSHLITNIWMDGRQVYGEAEILHKMPCGAALRGLFEHKARVGISSRGVGDMEVIEQGGQETYRVMPGYAFVTWDAVAEPSVSGAILNIQESLSKRLRPLKKEAKRLSPIAYDKLLVSEINNFFGLK